MPGFRFGRRYERCRAATGSSSPLQGGEPAVLASPAYIERLNAPTPWTTETMRCFPRHRCAPCATALRGGRSDRLARRRCCAPTAPWRPRRTGELVRRAGRRARHRPRAAVDCVRHADPVRHRRDEEPRQGPARRRRLRRRVRAPRGCRASCGRPPAAPPSALGVSGASAIGVDALLCVYPGAKTLTTV